MRHSCNVSGHIIYICAAFQDDRPGVVVVVQCMLN